MERPRTSTKTKPSEAGATTRGRTPQPSLQRNRANADAKHDLKPITQTGAQQKTKEPGATHRKGATLPAMPELGPPGRDREKPGPITALRRKGETAQQGPSPTQRQATAPEGNPTGSRKAAASTQRQATQGWKLPLRSWSGQEHAQKPNPRRSRDHQGPHTTA